MTEPLILPIGDAAFVIVCPESLQAVEAMLRASGALTDAEQDTLAWVTGLRLRALAAGTDAPQHDGLPPAADDDEGAS